MRLLTLRLQAFGPFADQELDFRTPEMGFHLVYGANEAGKSTSLRALVALLYGIPHRSVDAWHHPYARLAVGARLELNDGRILSLTRYKRRKNDLVDDDTGRPVSQAELENGLGHINREAFIQAFGISHSALRQGVESVLAAGGELGASIFAATSGLSMLKGVMTHLEQRQAELFKPRASKPAINAGVIHLGALRRELRDASASHREWAQKRDHLQTLRKRHAALNAKIRECSAALNRRSRLHRSLKLVARRQELQAALKSAGDLPELPDDFSERRFEAQKAIGVMAHGEELRNRDLQSLTDKLAECVVDPSLLAHGEQITALAAEAHVHTKALADAARLGNEAEQLRRAALQSLTKLRPGLDVPAAEKLRLSNPARRRISRLATRHAGLARELLEARQAGDAALAEQQRADEQLAALAAPQETSAVMASLERARSALGLEAILADARSEVAAWQSQITVDLAALGQWQGTLETLEALPLPADDTIQRFTSRMEDVAQRRASAEHDATQLRHQIQQRRQALQELVQTVEPPSPAALEKQRRLRDRGWAAVRRVWLEGGATDEDFLAAFPDCRDLAGAYEHSVILADRTSDRLRHEAQSVARAAALEAEIEETGDRIRLVEVNLKELETRRQALADEWDAVWAPLGIAPLPPREMTGWTTRATRIKQRAADLRARQIQMARLEDEIQHATSDLRRALQQVGESPPETALLAGLTERARTICRREESLAARRSELQRQIERSRQAIAHHQSRQQAALSEYTSWEADWQAALSLLELPLQTLPDEVNEFILALDEALALVDQSQDHEGRAASIQRDYEDFSRRVAAVAAWGPDLSDRRPAEAAIELGLRLEAEREIRRTRERLQQERDALQTRLQQDRQELAAQRETLRLMCAAAGVADPADLPAVEARVRHRAQTRTTLEAIEEQLADQAAGEPLGEFVAEVMQQDPDSLSADLERLQLEKGRLQEEEKKLIGDIALARRESESLNGQSRATAIAESIEAQAEALRTEVARFVRLRLAAQILAQSIERYRASHQNPVLERAAGYFQTMTGGAFAGMQADFNEQGEPVLKAVRPAGTRLGVHELSDGSRDQLFLALRLGALARYVDQNGPLPFIVDDVLVHFDDERARAALAALGDLARRTQIVFFTHHQHLVALARSAVAQDNLKCHNL
jgi:uncharacterized protein YhaN